MTWRWIEAPGSGRTTGPDAWDGYSALLAADACIAPLRPGSPQKVARSVVPAPYAGEGSEVVS
jgi:myo-inositol 2-dehydrogenase / D-chiro-inositol 1-dehydrogenase